MVKIAKNYFARKSNLVEWLVWEKLKDTVDVVFIAPCVEVAKDGSWLVQVRAESSGVGFPEDKAPFWMCDYQKPANCGILNGNLVQVDYGHEDTAIKLGIAVPEIKIEIV